MYTKKIDGTFNIIVNGMPYNTIKGDKYYESTLKQYKEHPELFEVEKEYIKTLEELKQEKIQELKSNCSAFIYSKYPIYKQLNVANGLAIEEETNQMHSFINKIRLICNEKESQINSLETAEEVKGFDVEFIIDKNNK